MNTSKFLFCQNICTCEWANVQSSLSSIMQPRMWLKLIYSRETWLRIGKVYAKAYKVIKKRKGSEWANAAENYWMRLFLEFPAFLSLLMDFHIFWSFFTIRNAAWMASLTSKSRSKHGHRRRRWKTLKIEKIQLNAPFGKLWCCVWCGAQYKKAAFSLFSHTASSTVAAVANWIFPHTCVYHDIVLIPRRMLTISSDRGNVWNSLLDYFYTRMASLHNIRPHRRMKLIIIAWRLEEFRFQGYDDGNREKKNVKKTRLSFEECQTKPMNGKCARKSNVALTTMRARMACLLEITWEIYMSFWSSD